MTRKLFIAAFGLGLALATGGAHAAKARSTDFTAADVAGKALVLLSTSADRTSWSSGTVLFLKRVEMKDGSATQDHIDTLYVDNPTVKSHSKTEHMNVHWRALAPGDYVLERTLLNPIACFTTFVTYHFTVVAGSSVYLGEFRLEGGVPVLRENYSRDYAYFSANANGEKPAAFSPSPPAVETKENADCKKHY